MDLELIQVTYEDLLHIRDTWNPEMNDFQIRQSSNLLRNLLVYNNLNKTWREFFSDRKMYIEAPSTDMLLTFIPFEAIDSYISGGVQFRKGTLASFASYNRSLSDSEVKNFQTYCTPDNQIQKIRLSKFIDDATIIAKGLKISRKDVVDFIANKLGGTHLDQNRDKEKDSLLNELHKQWKVLDETPVLFYELYCIGKFLIDSPDCKELIIRCEETLEKHDQKQRKWTRSE